MRTVKKFPLHGHDYYEMEITVEGESMATVNGQSVPLRKGTELIARYKAERARHEQVMDDALAKILSMLGGQA